MSKLRKQVRNICPEKAGVLANFSRRTQMYCELWSWQHWRVILFKEKRKNMKARIRGSLRFKSVPYLCWRRNRKTGKSFWILYLRMKNWFSGRKIFLSGLRKLERYLFTRYLFTYNTFTFGIQKWGLKNQLLRFIPKNVALNVI